MGTNALVAHGFKVLDSTGSEVTPTERVMHSDGCTRVLKVVLQETVLEPNQIKLLKGTVPREGRKDPEEEYGLCHLSRCSGRRTVTYQTP